MRFFSLRLLHLLPVFDESLNAGCYLFHTPPDFDVIYFHAFIYNYFFIKQGINEIQEEKQIIPQIILLCSLYIHTFAKKINLMFILK